MSKTRINSRARYGSGSPRFKICGARRAEPGFTLLELIVACAILTVLATAALPLVKATIVRRHENELRYDLLEMRKAIDRYKDDADKGLIQIQAGTEGYPPDLDTLVKGVQLAGTTNRRVRYLREIPTDPMTGRKDWGLRSVQDDSDSTMWGGQDVFDVYSKSTGTGSDGTAYSSW
ncbi:MAG TPA: type II secretion system protein [Candidatus Acidoferrales bacterium]|nr:type II secretion system protein [Candidatus Acidoferrales bacterium]